METKSRSAAKSLSWRITAVLIALFVAYIFTRNLVIAGLITLFDAIISFMAYYIHERIWSRIKWGYM